MKKPPPNRRLANCPLANGMARENGAFARSSAKAGPARAAGLGGGEGVLWAIQLRRSALAGRRFTRDDRLSAVAVMFDSYLSIEF